MFKDNCLSYGRFNCKNVLIFALRSNIFVYLTKRSLFLEVVEIVFQKLLHVNSKLEFYDDLLFYLHIIFSF